jgi:hypothetical protein
VTLLYLAEAQRIHGISEAFTNASQGFDLANHHGYDALAVEARRLMVETVLDEDAFDTAEVSSWLDEAEALATRLHLQPEIAHCRFARSRLSARLGDEVHAAAELDDALARYHTMGIQFYEHRTQGMDRQPIACAPTPGCPWRRLS